MLNDRKLVKDFLVIHFDETRIDFVPRRDIAYGVQCWTVFTKWAFLHLANKLNASKEEVVSCIHIDNTLLENRIRQDIFLTKKL